MKKELLELANSLGFDLCRVASAQPPDTMPVYRKWIEDGCHGSMHYLGKNLHKRGNLEEILPGIKSVVSLAVSYLPSDPDSLPDTQAENRNAKGTVARYARFHDYHQVLEKPLRILCDWLDERSGTDRRSLWYVDTGPILERDLAQRAGIGFVGKHTNLISRELGNWFFLAEILTQAEIQPDSKEKNRCGKCERCITACPTRAIIRPFQLDARKCISYLTIELKGSIPEELRPSMGNRIFGCDDCLAACPWNRFAKEASLMKRHARSDLDFPDLLGLLSLSDGQFREQFRHTPLFRAKRRGLVRNVCVALGNSGNKEALPALEKARNDSEPLIAEHAAWAVSRLENQLGGH